MSSIVILIAVFANCRSHLITLRISSAMRCLHLLRGRMAVAWRTLLGTDDVGRDVLSRLMYGARLSLLVGCLVVVLSLIIGDCAWPGGGLLRRHRR